MALTAAFLAGLSACGGSGGGASGGTGTDTPTGNAGGGDNTPTVPTTPTLTTLHQWNFQSAEGWLLSAEPATAATTQIDAGQLRMQAAMYEIQGGGIGCPKSIAEVPLTDSRLAAGSLETLAFDLTVSRWDLGLGRFDTDVPRLELVYRGHRYRWGVSGFTAMPGTVRLQGGPAMGWTASYNGAAAVSTTPVVTDDAGAPSLRLWIDGCSEGMSQRLEITGLTVSGA